MEYIIKREYNNGDQDILEIYHTTNKIKEVYLSTYIDEETGDEVPNTEVLYWNATEKNPLVIAKSRKDDYSVSDEILEIDEQISESF